MQALRLMLLTSGLVTLRSTWSQEVHIGRCSYAGVMHLEGGGQYSLNYQQAMQLCLNQGYSLATEEQLTKAYNQGLKTCRYGWIEGQKTSFLPHDADPDCSLNFTGISSHAEEEDQLYDVYCFTHTDSQEISCGDAATPTPTPVNRPNPPTELPSPAAKPEEEDVLDEVIADGFIVDTKEKTSVKTEILEVTYTTATTTNLGGHPSELPSLEDTTTTTSLTTVPTDPKVIEEEVKAESTFISEEPKDEITQTSPTVTPDQDTTAFPKETSEALTAQMVSTDPGITERDTRRDTTTEETIQNFINMEVEGSGMSPETLHSSTRLVWFPEAVDGSGVEPDLTLTSKGTPKPTTTEAVEVLEPEIDVAVANPEIHADGSIRNQGRKNLPTDPQPTTSAQADEGTPGWLIIFAFCMTLGAILCILAGIATKDKWYGPSRRSLNITPADESSKAATLPLSEKEQELVTLMNGGQKTDKDSTIVSVDEAPEKEYLM